ncbi:MAG: hypothetical protein ABFD44_12790, partial [Anaerolineaceae bacterium]
TRKLMLAAIGTASLAQDELEDFFNRMVDRGEIAETDARKLIREVMDRREKLEKEKRAQDQKTHPAAATKADVDALTARIADLTRQIEELKKEKKTE